MVAAYSVMYLHLTRFVNPLAKSIVAVMANVFIWMSILVTNLHTGTLTETSLTSVPDPYGLPVIGILQKFYMSEQFLCPKMPLGPQSVWCS